MGKSFWDILAWVSLAGIAVWLVLKMAGIINTPVWIEYSPLLGAVYMAGWAMSKLSMVARDVEVLKRDLGRMKGDMMGVKGDIAQIKMNCPNC